MNGALNNSIAHSTTGPRIWASGGSLRRYQRERPRELLHLDIKKRAQTAGFSTCRTGKKQAHGYEISVSTTSAGRHNAALSPHTTIGRSMRIGCFWIAAKISSSVTAGSPRPSSS